MNTDTASVTHPGAQDAQEPDSPFRYEDEIKILTTLINDRDSEAERTRERRERRENRCNVDELRANDEILEDETWIPDHTIKKNIKTAMASYIKFITQSPDVLFFKDIEFPDTDFMPLTSWLSDIFRMGSWKAPWFQLADCVLTHGGGTLELMPRMDLPQQAEVDYIRRENLIIPAQTRSIAACSRIGRRYELTKSDFENFATTYGWDMSAVAKVKEARRNDSDFLIADKWYMRAPNGGQLYVSWTLDRKYGHDNWLSEPRQLPGTVFRQSVDLLGNPMFIPTPELEIPMYFFPLEITEDSTLLSIQGRVAHDLPTQEAAEHVISGIVNTVIRSSQFYPTRLPDPDGTIKHEPLGKLKPGHVYPGQFSVFQAASPNPVGLSLLQTLRVQNAAEIGEVDFAAMSRQDTAKRATEITAATAKAQELSTVSLELFSDSCLNLYKRWLRLIVFAVQRKALRVPPPVEQLLMRTQHPACLISMAADITVIKAQQTTQKFLTHFPMVSGTPFAQVYYEEMLQQLFPEEYPRWKQAVGETNMTRQLLMQILENVKQVDLASVPIPVQNLLKNIVNAITANAQPPATHDGF